MYDYVTGKLTAIYPTYIVVDVNGIGYALQVANPFSYTTHLQGTVTVYVYQAVREDAITLYGFSSPDEKQLFLKLISVSGIGPKSALSILASDDSMGLIQAIETDNITYLTKFPGVGKKTAGQLVLDLKGKFSDTINVPSHDEQQPMSTGVMDEVKEALLGLGYSSREIQKIMPFLEKENFAETSIALRYAFKLLLGKK